MVNRKMRVISALAAVMMLLTMATIAMPVSVSAETLYDEVISATGLKDVSALPDIADGLVSGVTDYKVTNRAGMDKISELINQPIESANTFAEYTFTQAADIDMGDQPFNPIGHAVSQGNSYTINPDRSVAFQGTFDGNGFVLDNLTILEPNRYGTGLFGYAKNATFKNIGIAGGLILGGNEVAGIVGWGDTNLTFSNCWNAAAIFSTVGGSDGVAGIVGRANGAKYYLYNCYNLGLVYNRAGTASGLTGWCNNNDYRIWNSYNYGQIITRLNALTQPGDQFKGYNAIMRCAVTTARNVGSNNYFRSDCGQRSYKEAKDNGLNSNYVKVNDAGVAKTAAEFASLASALNNDGEYSPNLIGSEEGYKVEFEDSTAGYPVIVYKSGDEVVVKRTAHAATETFRADYMASHSAIMAALLANEVPCTATEWKESTAFDFNNAAVIASANDLMIATLIFQGQSTASFKVDAFTFTADIDMNDQDLFPGVTWSTPFLNSAGYQFTAAVEGNNHVIRNWKAFVSISPAGSSVAANATGGLFGGSENFTLQNLGMINADVYYAKYAAEGTAYTYPSLMAGYTSGGSSTTITSCFATGAIHILDAASANANNNSALLGRIMGSAENVHVNDSWGDVTVYNYNGSVTKARVVGSAAQNNASNTFSNVAYVAPNLVSGADQNVHVYQTNINPASTMEMAWMLNTGSIPHNVYWTVENDEVVWGTAANAVHKATFRVSLGDEATYAKTGDMVELPVYEGYSVDLESLPMGSTETYFIMPAEDLVVEYRADGLDILYIQRILNTYGPMDPALFVDGSSLSALVAKAEAIMADPENATAEDENELRGLEALLTLEPKNEYPYYPKYADQQYYTEFGYTSYLISDKEDWFAAVEASAGITNFFRGKTLYVVNDIDFENIEMAPLGAGTYNDLILEGQGHVLKNVNIVNTDPDANCGLVAQAAGSAIIRDLGIESGSITSSATNNNMGTGAFTGILSSGGRILHCWNGASVTNTATGDICISGIAGRGMSGSVIDNCYNIGAVTGLNSIHASAMNDWAQQDANGSGYVTNSFNAGLLTSAGSKYMVRGGNEGRVVNLWTTTALTAISSTKRETNSGALTAAAYGNGELAYMLNSSYVSGSGAQPYYTVEDGKTVFGDETNQTRKVTVQIEGTEDVVFYWNAGTVHTIDIGTEATFELTSGNSVLAGNSLTMGTDDAVITATLTGLNTIALNQYVSAYEAKNLNYYAAEFRAKIAAARAKLTGGAYTTQEEINNDLADLIDSMAYNEAPSLPSTSEIDDYSDAPAFALRTPDDLIYLRVNKDKFTTTVYMAADIDMSDFAWTSGISGLTANFDGMGYTISNLSGATTGVNGLFGTFAGSYVKNLIIDGASLTGGYGRAILMSNTTGGEGPLTIDNITIVNSVLCCGSSSSGVNRGAMILSRSDRGEEVNISNIRIQNCEITAPEDVKPMNVGFVLGNPTACVYNLENILIDSCSINGMARSSGVGFVSGGTENGVTLNLKNTAVINCVGHASGYCYQISGEDKNDAAIHMENVIAFNNTNCSAELVRMDSTPGTLDGTEVYTTGYSAWNSPEQMHPVIEGFNQRVAAERFTNGEVIYRFNENAGAAVLAVAEGTVVPASEINVAPVKVTFDDGAEYVADLYTDVQGRLLGLSEELMEAASWDYDGDLGEAVFTENTTISGAAHIWAYTDNGNGTHTANCAECGMSVISDCSYGAYAFDDDSDPRTHTRICTLCGGKATESCNDLLYSVEDPTHTEPGVIHHGCSICGNTWQEVGAPALGHNYEGAAWVHVSGTSGVDSMHRQYCADGDGGYRDEACVFEDGICIVCGASSAVKMGDVNGDGKVTVADAVAILRYLANGANSGFIEAMADMDGDGSITTADAVAVLQSLHAKA